MSQEVKYLAAEEKVVRGRGRAVIEPTRPEEPEAETKESEGHRLLSEFNSLPSVLKTWEFGNVKISMRRTSAEIDKTDPSVLRAQIQFFIEPPGHESVLFEPSDFITRFGARTKKKFIRLFEAITGAVVDEIAAHIIDFETAREVVEEKYHIGHEEKTEVRLPIGRTLER